MTSAAIASLPAEFPVDTRAEAAAPPRKRRRRTAAGGATDDCFACSRRGVKCDRKRPYCTQCIDIGKDCSGYKTTLTWGVGVASRGKLRGLTCPVARKNADGSDFVPPASDSRKRKCSVSKVKKKTAEAASKSTPTSHVPFGEPSTMASQPAPRQTLPPPTLPIPIPQTHNSWQIPSFNSHLESQQSDVRPESFQLPPLQRIHTALGSQYDIPDMPTSGLSMASYAETEFHSPLEFPHTPGSMAFSDHLQPNPFADQPMTASSTDSYSMSGTSMESFVDQMQVTAESTQRNHHFADSGTMNPSHARLGTPDAMLFGGNDMSYGAFDPFGSPPPDDGDGEQGNTVYIDSRFSSPFFHLSPRLQSLMEHYSTFVCPFLVSFDGPQNPYRRHILQLAVHHEGLQSALAALATNNIRMRRKEAQQIGFIEELSEGLDAKHSRAFNDATPEETLYKQLSIDHLNLQLTNLNAARDDSVLATLLILCLFHVCDSGFSKFKTQLAGVQKLLSLRNPNVQSDFTGWVEMFFTWFDVMTSTVNDREMQIKGESLDMLDFSANLGVLEQFSGCDGRLFKLIARLGRLNLLAQGRPVRSSGGAQPTPALPAVKRPRTRASRRKRPTAKIRANKSLSAQDYENMDGNGWGSPIISSDEDADGSADEDLAAVPDERREFWREWNEVRARLQTWQVDSSPSVLPTNDVPQFNTDKDDLVHINETFRFSALLYTERLGSPVLPSSHAQFQQLVSQALYHITALPVSSCVNKFLLWPLFITGTECVDEGHRDIIRTRCVEIQKESGFFNNISGLEVLERVWREVGSNTQGHEVEEIRARRRDSEAGHHGRRYGQAFRWRKAMDRADGEYIVI
ncbi:hypothetical protein LTR08_001761 [Meristemomyces frigidus]|nr:hypothetical protein LTR08_001761 [Meristemomyces frigidus]